MIFFAAVQSDKAALQSDNAALKPYGRVAAI